MPDTAETLRRAIERQPRRSDVQRDFCGMSVVMFTSKVAPPRLV